MIMQTSLNSGSATWTRLDFNLPTSSSFLKPIIDCALRATDNTLSPMDDNFTADSTYSLSSANKKTMGRNSKPLSSTMDIFDENSM